MRIRDEQLINRFHEFMDDHEIKSIKAVSNIIEKYVAA